MLDEEKPIMRVRIKMAWNLTSEIRPAQPDQESTEPRPRGHCYDAEKCNSDTFCECPCRTCTRSKRGEGASYETRA